jgi:hypothetical protein
MVWLQHREYVHDLFDSFYSIMDRLIEQIYGLVEEDRANEISDMYQAIAEGFSSVSKVALTALTNYIFNDLQETLDKIYTKEYLEKDDLIELVVATLKDYFEDIQTCIAEQYFKKLVRYYKYFGYISDILQALECLQRIVYSYIEQLFNKTKLSLTEEICDRMVNDEFTLRDFFRGYTRKNVMNTALQILVDLSELFKA